LGYRRLEILCVTHSIDPAHEAMRRKLHLATAPSPQTFLFGGRSLYSALLQEYERLPSQRTRQTVFELRAIRLAARCYAWGLPQPAKENGKITCP